MKTIDNILLDIQSYEPVDDDWCDLDELIQEACDFDDENVIPTLLGILERYPEHDGYGVFWSVVHGVEAIGNYESYLVKSVLAKPHELSLVMLNRLLKSGVVSIDDILITDVFNEVAANTNVAESIREEAKRFLNAQSSNT